jgi:hypothetical protein
MLGCRAFITLDTDIINKSVRIGEELGVRVAEAS